MLVLDLFIRNPSSSSYAWSSLWSSSFESSSRIFFALILRSFLYYVISSPYFFSYFSLNANISSEVRLTYFANYLGLKWGIHKSFFFALCYYIKPSVRRESTSIPYTSTLFRLSLWIDITRVHYSIYLVLTFVSLPFLTASIFLTG